MNFPDIAPGDRWHGVLTGLLDHPVEVRIDAAPATARGRAVIAHPHPLFGGNLDNKVAYTLARAAAQAGLDALRCNFRGVGKSGGTHAGGIGEAADLARIAQAWRQPGQPLVLLGFSFGGAMSLLAAETVRPAGVLTVAPPLDYPGATPALTVRNWWLIHGLADDVVAAAPTLARAAAAPVPAVRMESVPGVGHFFHGELARLSAFCADFFAALPAET